MSRYETRGPGENQKTEAGTGDREREKRRSRSWSSTSCAWQLSEARWHRSWETRHDHMTGSAKYARYTVSLLSRTKVRSGTLYDALQTLPCRRDMDEWDNYLAQVLPLLDTIIATYEVKRLRRLRFQSFMKRDKILDAICERITASRENVLVAFGDASSCHTGFGYAPAPLGRLRRRLSVLHGAKVTLVDEYNTSQYCCQCHHALLEVKTVHSIC